MTGKQRAYLRGMGQKLPALYQIGKNGIEDNLIATIDEALNAKELIKVSVQQYAPIDAYEACNVLCEKLGAEPIQTIGRKFVIFRRNNEEPIISIPV